MAIDPSRAAFISQEYRYESTTDTAVLTAYPQANLIEIDTNLSTSDAATLATTILNATKTLAMVFEVEIEGVLVPEDFDGTVNHYTLSAPLYSTDSRTFKVIAAEVDYLSNITKLTVRG